MDIGSIIRQARLDSGLAMKTVEAATGIIASTQSKIELGETVQPAFTVIARLAKYYNLSLDGIYEAMSTSENSNLVAANARKTIQLPVISWSRAGKKGITRADHEGHVIPSPFNCSSDAYALEIKDESMASISGQSNSFHEHSVIVVEPKAKANHKSLIIVKTEGSTEATFRQLIIDSTGKHLKPINPQYPLSTLNPKDIVCGVVIGQIQRSGT